MNPSPTVGLLIDGATLAAVLMIVVTVLGRLIGATRVKAVLVAVVVAAALAYVGFALAAGETGLWLVAELIGVGIYGGLAWRGIRGSRWWLVAAWAAHPLWDVLLHHLGPGGSFAPISYTIPCLSFDLLIAAYIALAARTWSARPTVPARSRA